MKKYLILLFTVLTSLHVSAQSDGSQLWLGKQYANSCQVISQLPNDATAKIAKQELENNWRGKNVELKIDKSLNLGEGYNIYARPAQQGDNIQYEATITASNPIGLLYGAYELIRLQNTDAYNTGSGNQQNFSKAIDETEKPQVGLRILNHWDNLDGSIERGYAGKSIFKWEEIKLGKNGKGGSISKSLHDRLITYARANASLGINGSVLNNVNASPKMMTAEYINKVKVIANILRPYGIRVYLSINFASPMALGYTKTADPLDKKVQQWWKKKAKEIYATIPDFGGFLVKANSEGQPGPGDYHRTHADGANMLADAVKPYGGIIMWRSFVYGANHKGEDRVKQAVSEFKGMDGKFRDNVILQSKNGPLDFQPREPYAPIYNAKNDALFDANGKLIASRLSGYDDLDWQDGVERTGHRQEYNVSGAISGEKFNVYASAGYLNEKGYTKNSAFDIIRVQLRDVTIESCAIYYIKRLVSILYQGSDTTDVDSWSLTWLTV
jgi:alpha-glucuronidase